MVCQHLDQNVFVLTVQTGQMSDSDSQVLFRAPLKTDLLLLVCINGNLEMKSNT